jgi:hypothetical protein
MEPKTVIVDVAPLIRGEVDAIQVDMWTEAKGMHHVKIRVVEEVEIMYGLCNGCGYGDCSDMVPPYCPGCGNPIKRA